MTVKKLKEILSSLDDNLEVMVKVVDNVMDERNERISHIETNDTEFYLIGESGRLLPSLKYIPSHIKFHQRTFEEE